MHKKLGKEKLQEILEKMGILKRSNFELSEVGTPLDFNWEKCRLETISFGHGITTTPLQAASAYAGILNGGMMVEPTILKREERVNRKKISK